jgi:NAD(P)-dependent dehydrogenase (short-subunit alcohol dehydrogenase family)
MENKIVLITGANGGLGKHVTQAFLSAGATVVGASTKIRQSDFDDTRFLAVPADISTLTETQELIDKVTARFGKLDVVVHTVGGFAGGQSIAEIDDATFQHMFDVNLNSTFYLLRAVLPVMRKTGSGRIIAVGSRAALEPGARVGAYSASKAAMVSLIKTVALENKDVGISANVILPGTIDTPANRKAMPKGDFSKWVQPSNVAALIVWLAGEAGKDVNGAAIPVYGSEV